MLYEVMTIGIILSFCVLLPLQARAQSYTLDTYLEEVQQHNSYNFV